MKTSKLTLMQIATIKSGYPFRAKIEQQVSANTKVVQPRDIDCFCQLQTANLVTTSLPGKRQADFLQQGDILFINKGYRNVACHIDEPMPTTTLSPALLLLRLLPEYKNQVNSLFLVWQLNSLRIQHYLKTRAEGTVHLGIRNATLAEVEIILPSITKQNVIAKLYQANLQQQKTLLALLNNNQQQLNTLENLI